MDIELLAKKMREDSLAKDSHWTRKVEELKALRIKMEREEKERQERALENIKKIYFHAGRYAGGARDKGALEAHARVSRMSMQEVVK
jgi:hypothetical protein